MLIIVVPNLAFYVSSFHLAQINSSFEIKGKIDSDITSFSNSSRNNKEVLKGESNTYFFSSPAFNASLFQGFPDIKQTIEDVIAQSDRVMYRTTMQRTHTGEFLGISPTGKSAKINDFTLLRIVNDRIVEWWYECNLLELMKQLGLS